MGCTFTTEAVIEINKGDCEIKKIKSFTNSTDNQSSEVCQIDNTKKLRILWKSEQCANNNVIDDTKDDVMDDTKDDVMDNTKDDVMDNTKDDVMDDTKDDVMDNTKDDVMDNTK